MVDRMRVAVVGFDDLEPVHAERVDESECGGVGFDDGERSIGGTIPPRHRGRQT